MPFVKIIQNNIECLYNKKAVIILSQLVAFVGITGLEPATSRPPDVCATNCAKSRTNS